MFFILPIGVEGFAVRVPIVCVGIAALCLVAFFGTWVLPDDPEGYAQVRTAARYWLEHPYLDVPASFDSFLKPQARARLRDDWLKDNTPPGADTQTAQQEALDQLFADAKAGLEGSPMRRYSLVPARGAGQVGWLTHMFLHFGWLHLLGNLLFFYVCGPMLEDTWGRKLFLAFYLLGGLAAGGAWFLAERHSTAMMAGASGAIAACMGAFAVRFARRKVLLAYLILIGFRPLRGIWKWPAWVCGLIWLGNELVSVVTGDDGGVAVMAHVGGFAFGAAVSFGMKAAGWEKAFIATSEIPDGPLTRSYSPGVTAAQAALAKGDQAAARAEFTAALAKDAQDADAAAGLVRLDLQEGRRAHGATRLDALLTRLLRAKNEPHALALLWDLWPLLQPGELKPATAFALAKAADGELAERALAQPLYERAGAAPGLMGAKAQLRAAELLLGTQDAPRAGPLLDGVLAKPEAADLHAKARALRATVPAPQVAAQDASGLALGKADHAQGFNPTPQDGFSFGSLDAPAERPTRRVLPCVLTAASAAGLRLRAANGAEHAVPLPEVLGVAAGLVPKAVAGAAPRGVLLVDLIMAWGDARSAAVSMRLDSDTTVMSKLFPGKSAAEVYSAFFTLLLEASGATALPDVTSLTGGKFARYASAEAYEAAIFQ